MDVRSAEPELRALMASGLNRALRRRQAELRSSLGHASRIEQRRAELGTQIGRFRAG